MFASLFEKLSIIDGISEKSQSTENWGNISFSGINNDENITCFQELFSELESLGLKNSVNCIIEKKSISIQEFFTDIQQGDSWRININKNVLLNRDTKRIYYNFFYSKEKFIDWLKNTDPFAEEYPLNDKRIHIVVNNLEDNFGGFNFVVCNQSYPQDLNNNTDNWEDYNEDLISDNIHIISNSKLIVQPLKHYLSFGKVTEVSKYFYRNSIIVLLASLCNEIYEGGNIVLRGFRRIEFELGLGYWGNEISAEYQENLANAVKWVYQSTERSDLRLKLLLERITLDIDYRLPYFQGLFEIIESATKQAKERYSFIIYDRKDLYQKELKDLLRDLKILTDLYSSKLRSLLSNLLRDVLAAFILVGITLFSKTTEIQKLFENSTIKYVFIAFGGYFIISAIFQLVTDVFDIYRSNKEFDYWKNISREYMSQIDFETHKSKTLTVRANGTMLLYGLVILLYLIIAFVCFSFPCIWHKIIN
jgi:hypothetical protein